MSGGLMKYSSRLAIAAAAGLFMNGAAHAGGAIGGDCCADLEERVAELEATTARKGNRKVSLTVYGQLNKAILFTGEIDVGTAPATGSGDVEIIDNDVSDTRFGLKGKANITSDLYAGYKIEFGVPHGDIYLRHNDLYLGSKTFGKVSIGQGSTASDGITEISFSGTDSVAGGAGAGIAGVYTTGVEYDNLDGFSRKERVRYDSPSIAGFVVSASWQDNEDFDVALRYGASFGDFTVAAGVAYFESDDDNFDAVSGSVALIHNPTGLNASFAAGEQDGADNVEYWFVQAGIKRKYFALGDTKFSVDYHVQEVNGVESEKIGAQLVQDIDAAAMELFIAGWSSETDDLSKTDEDAIMVGARIEF